MLGLPVLEVWSWILGSGTCRLTPCGLCPVLGTRWWSRRMCTHLLLWELQNCNQPLNNHQLENVASQPINDTPHPRAKEKPQQDSRRCKITFRTKLHTQKRCSEGSNKTLCAPGPREPTRDWARTAFECLSVSCGGMGQQRPAMGTGALAVADLGGAACEPHHRAAKQTTHRLENNYTKEVLTLLPKF